MFIAAADTLSSMISKEDLSRGRLYPPLEKIRDISFNIAVNVAQVAFDNKIAQLPCPENLEKSVRDTMFQPNYPLYV